MWTHAWNGEVPGGRIKKVDAWIKTWCPPGKRPGDLGDDRRTSSKQGQGYKRDQSPTCGLMRESERVARGQHRRLGWERRAAVRIPGEGGGQLFKTERLGSIGELGTKRTSSILEGNRTPAPRSTNSRRRCAARRVVTGDRDQERRRRFGRGGKARATREAARRVSAAERTAAKPAARVPAQKGSSRQSSSRPRSKGGQRSPSRTERTPGEDLVDVGRGAAALAPPDQRLKTISPHRPG